MPATISPLQLDTYFLKEISYVLKDDLLTAPGTKTNAKTIDLDIKDLTSLVDEKGNRWRCELEVSSEADNEDSFYSFKIVMVGFFTVAAGLNAESSKLIAEANSPAVLYSAAREIVATVTRRSPYPGTLLPTVTFVKQFPQEMSKEAPKRKKTVAKRKS